MTDDPISRIEAALEAGPTPGCWDADFASAMRNGSPAVVEYFVRRDDDDISIAADIVDPQSGLPSEANAAFIAACNPVAIRALLDERDRLRQIAHDAARSLESISNLAGLDQYMETMSDIRAYARSRADVARAALENTNGK